MLGQLCIFFTDFYIFFQYSENFSLNTCKSPKKTRIFAF